MKDSRLVVWTRDGSWLETRGKDGAAKYIGLGRLTVGEAEKRSYMEAVPLRVSEGYARSVPISDCGFNVKFRL